MSEQERDTAEKDAPADPRECGWLGCGHPRCEPSCAGVPLDEYLTWRESTRVIPPGEGNPS